MDMITEPYRLTRRCEVTAILVLYGLPRYPSDPDSVYAHYATLVEIPLIMMYQFSFYRLLTGSILAHEMMHAWHRLKGIHPASL